MEKEALKLQQENEQLAAAISQAEILKIFKQTNKKNILQEIYDFNFKQVEISIREIGYGDVSINKKMKEYLNFFHDIVGKVNNWENMDDAEKTLFFSKFH